MSITVLRKGNTLELVESTGEIPEGVPLVLFTKGELTSPNAWEAAQMQSAFDEEGEDWGKSLDGLVANDA